MTSSFVEVIRVFSGYFGVVGVVVVRAGVRGWDFAKFGFVYFRRRVVYFFYVVGNGCVFSEFSFGIC